MIRQVSRNVSVDLHGGLCVENDGRPCHATEPFYKPRSNIQIRSDLFDACLGSVQILTDSILKSQTF